MDAENLELLMERLISINEQILDRLDNIQSDMAEVRRELDSTVQHSYAQASLNDLHNIIMELQSITINTSGL